MRIHVLQVGYGDDESMADRVARVAAMVEAQVGADLVVLPELWAAGGFSYRTWPQRAEPVREHVREHVRREGRGDHVRGERVPGEPGEGTVAAIAAAARRVGAVVHAGSIVERAEDGGDHGPQGRGLWNTSVLIGPDGQLLATYRKIHRFGFGAGEPALLEAGQDVVTATLPDGTVVGLATCYDLRFPELFRRLLDAGARMVLVPAAWPQARVEAWALLGRARAIEDQMIIVQCNTAGTHAGITMGGRSQVVAATGEVLAVAGEDETALVVDVEVASVDAWRAAFPVLADRRL